MNHRVLTVGGVARAAGVSEWTVRQYARRNLIPYSLDSAGRRVFADSAVAAVRSVFAKHMAARGRANRSANPHAGEKAL